MTEEKIQKVLDNGDLSQIAENTKTTEEPSKDDPDQPIGEISETEEAEIPQEDISAPDETEILRNEITRLRSILEEKETAAERNMRELKEFMRLFPDTPLQNVPSEVWAKVKDGIPLSAAYALHEKELALMAYRAKEINDINAARSAGKAGAHDGNEYFSCDEVRMMSQKEVHENYDKIRSSMKHWR